MGEALHLRGVELTLPGAGGGGLPVLEGVTLHVAPGEVVAIVGPSGCGKSTLLDVAAGLVVPDGGRVAVGAGAGPPLGRAALMPQGESLLPWATVLDNAAVGARLGGAAGRAAREAARAALAAAGLAGFEHHYPHALSGGMRQRVALVRTLLARRPVWLLDEPFAALDALTRRELHADLLALAAEQRPTVLLVTHDTEEACVLADRVVVSGHRPMGHLREVRVDLPHPRDPVSVAPVRARVLRALEAAGAVRAVA